jgi:hypothetical protein
MTQPPWLPPLPCEGFSSFLGKFSSSEVYVNMSMTKVNMSIDGEDEREKSYWAVLRWRSSWLELGDWKTRSQVNE